MAQADITISGATDYGMNVSLREQSTDEEGTVRALDVTINTYAYALWLRNGLDVVIETKDARYTGTLDSVFFQQHVKGNYVTLCIIPVKKEAKR